MRSKAFEQGRRFGIHKGICLAVPKRWSASGYEFLQGVMEGIATRRMIVRAEAEDIRRRRKQADQLA